VYSSSASTTVLPNSNLPSMLPGQHFTSYEEMRLLVCGINCDKTLNQSFNLMQAPPDAAESRHSLRGAWLRGVDYSHFAAASSLNTQPVTSYFGAPRGFTRLAVRGSCLFSRSFTAFTERLRGKFYCWNHWFKLQSFRSISHSKLEREEVCVSAPVLPMRGSRMCEVRVHGESGDVVRISDRVARKVNDWFGEFSIPPCKTRCRDRASAFRSVSWVCCGEEMAPTGAFSSPQPR
jgi:hypothetical protein